MVQETVEGDKATSIGVECCEGLLWIPIDEPYLPLNTLRECIKKMLLAELVPVNILVTVRMACALHLILSFEY